MPERVEQLLEELRRYRNDMVAHNYPFQQISDIIVKWEHHLAEINELKKDRD